ncbi:MAG: FTR1 family protein, partial [Candidatus Thermoplasmatota archaeon]|nr:FTR1 family protein [Candidatus Thermoplasmatota archaeon]
IERLDIKKFFTVTGVLLIVFAAGLTATAVHEFNEAGVVPPVVNEVWNINPLQNPDGSYPLLHEKGAIGGIMKSLLGYNGNPSLTEVVAYASYWIVISGYLLLTNAETVKRMLRAMGAKVRLPLGKGRMAAIPSEDIRLDEATARRRVER